MKQLYLYSLALVLLVIFGLVYANYKCRLDFSPTTENVVIGLYTSFVTVIALEIVKAINFFRTYVWLEGKEWFEYGPAEEFGTSYTFETSTAKVEIYYIEKNLLSIKLTENTGDIWDGIMTMQVDNKYRGQIAWKYPYLNNDKRFGLKEVIVTSDEKHDYIYLMSLNFGMAHGLKDKSLNPPYGNMILRRTRT